MGRTPSPLVTIPPAVLDYRRRHYSLRDLSRIVGASDDTLGRIERGKPVRPDIVVAYLRALGCRLEVRVDRGRRFVDADEGIEKPER